MVIDFDLKTGKKGLGNGPTTSLADWSYASHQILTRLNRGGNSGKIPQHHIRCRKVLKTNLMSLKMIGVMTVLYLGEHDFDEITR